MNIGIPLRGALGAIVCSLVIAPAAFAGGISALSNRDVSRGLKQALGRGIDMAVAQLGTAGGFLADPRVRIPLPPPLAKADRVLRVMGMGRQMDALDVAMNRAAEAAVPAGRQILVQSLQRMTVADAKSILTGGGDSATEYFRRVAYARLQRKFTPIVAVETRRVGLAQKYDALAAQGASLGLLGRDDASIESYVTRKTLDGLFLVMAQQERAIRNNPLGQASSLLRRVFGAYRD